MKAYKVIFKLLRHPLSEVEVFGQYVVTHVSYNKYMRRFTLDSVTDKK